MNMCREQIYVFVVLLLGAVFPLSSSSFNKTSFVNDTKLRILAVMGHNGISHFEVSKPLLEQLARRGHHITVLSHFPRSEDAKVKEALPTYNDISLLDPKIGSLEGKLDIHSIRHTFVYPIKELYYMRQLADIACDIELNNPAVKKLLQSDEKFDLIITENFNTNCFLGFVHRYKAPYITISSHDILPWANEYMDNVNNPSYIPVVSLGFAKPLDFFHRIVNTLINSIFKIAYDHWSLRKDQAIANEVFGPYLPDLRDIAKQSRALLVNTHLSIHGNRPQLLNVVEIGGLHIPSKTNPLPKDVAEFLDSASEGVLYFNFGSVFRMSTMPRKQLDVILEVFDSIPRKIIWKWEDDVLPRKIANVMTKKWLPQFDVLSK